MSTVTLSPSHLDSPHVQDFVTLLKPKVMTLVVFAGFVGLYLAPNFNTLHPIIIFTAMLSLAIGAGAAGAINMWYDRDIDAVMTRTRTRPIPAGRINADEALTFGLVMAGLSVITMAVALNLLAAVLLAFSIFFYAVVYTMWLKRSTPQNIVIGGAAGAFPPLITYAAATGEISGIALALFALIFFWTPPHFWALALFIKDEYAQANVPMMPNVRGVRATKSQMLAYTILLVPLSVLPTILGATGWVYGTSALLLSGLFVVSAIRVLKTDDLKPARSMFGFSVLYLFALLALMMIDKV
jgi:protoheme IX farnesyltransferase